MYTKTTRFLGIDWRIAPDTRSDGIIIFLFWVVAFPIFIGTYDADLPLWSKFANTIWMSIIYSAVAWFIVNILNYSFLPERKLVFLFVFTILTLAAIYPLSWGAFHFIDPEPPRALNFRSWYWSIANDSQNAFMVVAVLTGKKFYDSQRRNLTLESERRQSELQRLRSQVDPHFLFNSLNILDILIDDDPATAKVFVHRLSNMYRYLIRHRDEDLVPATDEMQHARDYNFLVEQRFGTAFHFRENFEVAQLEKAYVPPGALQTVLENVYKHNLATERNPVTITIECRENALFIINDHSPKPGELATHERSGSGTANLFRRYALLTDEETYSRQLGAHWMARLPLLHLEDTSGLVTSLLIEKV
ncbi:MAG: sensor histidine kinase [Saprospiraceae bacterium]